MLLIFVMHMYFRISFHIWTIIFLLLPYVRNSYYNVTYYNVLKILIVTKHILIIRIFCYIKFFMFPHIIWLRPGAGFHGEGGKGEVKRFG